MASGKKPTALYAATRQEGSHGKIYGAEFNGKEQGLGEFKAPDERDWALHVRNGGNTE